MYRQNREDFNSCKIDLNLIGTITLVTLTKFYTVSSPCTSDLDCNKEVFNSCNIDTDY